MNIHPSTALCYEYNHYYYQDWFTMVIPYIELYKLVKGSFFCLYGALKTMVKIQQLVSCVQSSLT